MPYPNPLGFYSLEFAPEIEAELMNGDFAAISYLISDLSTLQTSPENYLFSTCFSDAADQAISNLIPSQQIALIRWAAERMDWMITRHKSKSND